MKKASIIAILGATSQIAKDLIVSFSKTANDNLHLFARRPDEVKRWLVSAGLAGRYPTDDFTEFAKQEFDAVINFVGVGNPAQAVAMGNTIFDITLRFDEMVLEYLRTHPACRYLFLSSGAVYGSSFAEPAKCDTPAIVPINKLAPHEWYGVAKLHAECRHRSHPELAIIDIRVFNYFSHTQDIEARFLITDILRAIRDKSVLKVSADNIVRDFVGPADFHKLVSCALSSPVFNSSIDCYTRAPVDKMSLLANICSKFGLIYEVDGQHCAVNATGVKKNYFSENRAAALMGYEPNFDALETVLNEMQFVFAA